MGPSVQKIISYYWDYKTMFVDFNDMTMMTRVLLMIHGGGKEKEKEEEEEQVDSRRCSVFHCLTTAS